MAEFFAMGGHGAYIWSAYGISALVLIGVFVASLRFLKNNEATLAALQAAQGLAPEDEKNGKEAA